MSLQRAARLGLVAILAGLGVACTSTGGAAHVSNCATENEVKPPVLDAGSTTASGNVITIDARDFEFSPTCIVSVPQGAVTLVVHNTGSQLHNITVVAQHIDRDVAPGATVRIPVVIANVPVVFACKYHRTIGMVGVLVPRRCGAREVGHCSGRSTRIRGVARPARHPTSWERVEDSRYRVRISGGTRSGWGWSQSRVENGPWSV